MVAIEPFGNAGVEEAVTAIAWPVLGWEPDGAGCPTGGAGEAWGCGIGGRPLEGIWSAATRRPRKSVGLLSLASRRVTADPPLAGTLPEL
jgi:hypothetical protein